MVVVGSGEMRARVCLCGCVWRTIFVARSDARLRNLFLSVEVGVQFLSVEVGVQTRAAPTRVSGTFGSGLRIDSTPTRVSGTRRASPASQLGNVIWGAGWKELMGIGFKAAEAVIGLFD